MEDVTGVPATTTTTAVLRALECLNVSRIAMATPYLDDVSQLEVDFFHKLGIEVTNWKGGGIVETADIQECSPDISYQRAKEVDNDRAEAIFISCTGFRSIENIAKLENELGKPVISANQATFADSLRILGINDVKEGYGSLFGEYLSQLSVVPEKVQLAG